MKKLVTALCVLMGISGSAQTLFYYGQDSVSASEFLRAWKKNNTGPKTQKALQDYLDLYISSRLKVKEAREKGYDTLPQMVSDLENLRQQILPAYLNDKESMQKLVDEAFIRGQKDIHLAHIFISFTQNGTVDSAAAEKKLNEVLRHIKANEDFATLARQYSDDPSAKQNGGDLGYITVFTLPYALENLAYATPAGKVSEVYKSKAGYHLFKNYSEQKDPGRVKAAQILLAFPPDASEADRARIKHLADSIYSRLQKGDDFATLASRFSNDVISAAANGQIPEFGIGQYEPEFERVVYELKEGAISKSFLTTHGYHIVKLLGKVPPLTSKADEKAIKMLQDRVEQSDRIASTKVNLARKVLKSTGFQIAPFNFSNLWAYSDSAFNYRVPDKPTGMNPQTALFRLGDKKVTINDWMNYAQTYRYKNDGSGVKPFSQVWDEFVDAMAIDYYQSHLEQYNPEFRQQLTEFKEGNLFFEIMQRQVWGPAQTDSVALEQYYQKNRSKYVWHESVDAAIFYASDAASANTFIEQLKKKPADWHTLAGNFGEKIAADSGRFDLAQIPNPQKQVLKPGIITKPLINKADNTASFAYIIRTYSKPEPRSFAEAKGLVINDYQDELEKEWVAELKKKYPVKVNETVLKNIEQGISNNEGRENFN